MMEHKDRLEDFVRKNQDGMDRYEPRPHLWDKISAELDADEGKTPVVNERPRGRVIQLGQVLRVAATLVILGGAIIFLLGRNGFSGGGGDTVDPIATTGTTSSQASPFAVHARFPELQEVEHEYQVLFSEQKDLLVNNEKFDGEDKASVLAFLDELETEYSLLEGEIEKLNDPDKLIGAMILNYQQRIEVLERLMQLLDSSPSEKTDKYENAIVL